MKFRFVCATRKSYAEFSNETLFGNSYAKIWDNSIELILYDNNISGLPEVYNNAIVRSWDDDVVLIFIHDDVAIIDLYWKKRLTDSLNKYSLVGVAGNTNFSIDQPSWNVIDTNLTWDKFENLRGAVWHGSDIVNIKRETFGQSPSRVRIIDGLFMACPISVIKRYSLKFDTIFNFHMYDVDFCRQIDSLNIPIGVADISLVHSSAGNADHTWASAFELYRKKWDC